MIEPIHIEFENFLSFQTLQNFEFKTQGIHYIYGINHDADIDNNDFAADSYNVGVGKSSLGLALQYAFYGDTQRKVNKDQIINKSTGKNLYVGLEFNVTSTNEKYMIQRYRRHDEFKNRLFFKKWNGKKWDDISGADLTQTQEFIDKIVVLDIHTFEKTSLLTREDKMQFLELPILNRGQIFENISQINKLKEYWWKARNRYKGTEDKIIDLNNDILKESTIINRDKKYIDETCDNDANKRKELTIIINNLQKELDDIISTNMDVITILDNVHEFETFMKKNIELYTKISEHFHYADLFGKESKTLTRDINDLTSDFKKIKIKIDEFKPKKCHNCGVIQEQEQYEKELKELTNQRDKIDTNLSLKQKLLDEAVSKKQGSLDEVSQLKHLQDKLKLDMDNVRLPSFIKEALINEDNDVILNIKNLNTNIQTQKSILQSIDSSETVAKLNIEIKQHEDVLNKIIQEKKDVLHMQEIYRFWLNVLDFKSENSLKQFVISKIIPLFNNFVQQMIDVVYKGNLIIAFDNFFNETIYYQGTEWKYDELSTGEKMKLNFCINLAIFDLTRVNMDSCGVIILDEIFTNVDTPTVIEFLNIIRDRYAKNNGVYIISHEQKVRDNLNPDSTILIEKRNRASEITKVEVHCI